ncbi:MAG: hypothetical protein SchgKO_17320 [Schleiferiaceae bacterium]
MGRHIASFALVFLSFAALGQTEQEILRGRVLSADSAKPIIDCYVINAKSHKGTTTDEFGFFEIYMSPEDTLVISNVQYMFGYYWTETGEIPKERQVIKLDPRNYLLDEVSLFSHGLTTNNPKPMPIGKPSVPSNSETTIRPMAMPSYTSPVDMLYYYFGSKPKQIRELMKLQREDAYRQQLKTGNNREILMEVTGLSAEEIEELAFYCKYTKTRISTMNDYELLMSILSCYNQFLQENGAEDILDQQSW